MSNTEETLYAIAAHEVASRTLRPGLFAKAFSESNGDEKRALAIYIKLRVKELAIEYKQIADTERKKEISRAQELAAHDRDESIRNESRRRLMERARITITSDGKMFFPCHNCGGSIELHKGYHVEKCPKCKQFVYSPDIGD